MTRGGQPERSRDTSRDWICPDPNCKNINWASRDVCNRCKSTKRPERPVTFEVGAGQQQRGSREPYEGRHEGGGAREPYARNDDNQRSMPRKRRYDETQGSGERTSTSTSTSRRDGNAAALRELSELRDEVANAHAQLEQKDSDLRTERARTAELADIVTALERDLDDASRRAQSVSTGSGTGSPRVTQQFHSPSVSALAAQLLFVQMTP